MKKLTNEETIITSNANKIILTNYRVYMKDKILGQSYSVGIFLENISSIEMKHKQRVIFLILAILNFIGGIYLGELSSAIVGVLIFAAIWWFTRRHVVSISSNGGSSLDFKVTGMSDYQVENFIYELSEAKLERIERLKYSE